MLCYAMVHNLSLPYLADAHLRQGRQMATTSAYGWVRGRERRRAANHHAWQGAARQQGGTTQRSTAQHSTAQQGTACCPASEFARGQRIVAALTQCPRHAQLTCSAARPRRTGSS